MVRVSDEDAAAALSAIPGRRIPPHLVCLAKKQPNYLSGVCNWGMMTVDVVQTDEGISICGLSAAACFCCVFCLLRRSLFCVQLGYFGMEFSLMFICHIIFFIHLLWAFLIFCLLFCSGKTLVSLVLSSSFQL